MQLSSCSKFARCFALAFFLFSGIPLRTSSANELSLEAGTEYDSNPQRLESLKEPSIVLQKHPSAVLRGAARYQGRLGLSNRHSLYGAGILGAKKFLEQDASTEDTALFSGELTLVRSLSSAARMGLRTRFVEMVERREGSNDDRDFRSAEGMFDFSIAEGRHFISMQPGARAFFYKPNDAFDFMGPVATAIVRLQLSAKDSPQQWAAHGSYRIENRRYSSPLLLECSRPRTDVPCLLSSEENQRDDLFHSLKLRMERTNNWLGSIEYEFQRNSSNSYAQTFARHKATLSATFALPNSWMLTSRALFQFTDFRDPLILGQDIGTYLTIEDETRNTAVLHATKRLSRQFSLEARAAFYTNELLSHRTSYRRNTVYLGVLAEL